MEELMFLDYLEMPLQQLRKHPDFDEDILQFVMIVSALKNQDMRDLRDGLDAVVGVYEEKNNG